MVSILDVRAVTGEQKLPWRQMLWVDLAASQVNRKEYAYRVNNRRNGLEEKQHDKCQRNAK